MKTFFSDLGYKNLNSEFLIKMIKNIYIHNVMKVK